jgi:hypothetical protein
MRWPPRAGATAKAVVKAIANTPWYRPRSGAGERSATKDIDAGFRGREAAHFGEIDSQEDEHEAADAIQQRPGEQHPERTRKAAEIRQPARAPHRPARYPSRT